MGNSQISWNDISVYSENIREGRVTRQIKRRPEVQKEYLEFCEKYNVNTYVFNNILSGKHYAITENEFPYNLESGITQYVFWINPFYEISEEAVEKILRKKFDIFVFFKNPVKFQSVKAIPHYQVFVKDLKER